MAVRGKERLLGSRDKSSHRWFYIDSRHPKTSQKIVAPRKQRRLTQTQSVNRDENWNMVRRDAVPNHGRLSNVWRMNFLRPSRRTMRIKQEDGGPLGGFKILQLIS